MIMKNDNKHILVVEDDDDFRNVVLTVLSDANYAPMGARNLREASLKLRNQKYSCVLIDIRLGEDSGIDIIDSMRKQQNTLNSNTPIIVISGFLDRDLVTKIASQVQGALVKPFESQALLACLEKVCGQL